MTVTSFKLTSIGRSDRCKRINGSYYDTIENRQLISYMGNRRGPFSLRGWMVAIDNGETLHKLAMERSKKDWMKTVGKQRDGREGIFMRLSEVPTNELHKYLYLYFMFYLSFNYQFSITI